MRKSPTVRHIKPETICIGDLIRVTHRHKDTETSVVGTVASRQVSPRMVEYQTAAGVTLLMHFYTTKADFTVTLLQRQESVTTLW